MIFSEDIIRSPPIVLRSQIESCISLITYDKPHWTRILEHLSKFNPDNYSITAPFCLTQDGIGSSVGISRAHAALILNHFAERGLVESRLLHVKGIKRRRKVYFPTHAGFQELQEMIP